jgi:hypothetical protein
MGEVYSFVMAVHNVLLMLDLGRAGAAFAAGCQLDGMEIRAGEPADPFLFGLFKKFGDRLQQTRQVQRLLHDRIDAEVGCAVVLMWSGGDNNHRHKRMGAVDEFEDFPAVSVRHRDIQQDEVREFFDELGARLPSCAGGHDGIILRFQNTPQHVANARIIISEQDFLFHNQTFMQMVQVPLAERVPSRIIRRNGGFAGVFAGPGNYGTRCLQTRFAALQRFLALRRAGVRIRWLSFTDKAGRVVIKCN